ncbi:MAG: PAS domain-containing protein [Nitrospirae bacterium]|nr:PAS domain-containing protein [Nitrospirota bacterium]
MPPKASKKKRQPKTKPSLRARSGIAPPPLKTVLPAKEELFAKVFRSSPHPIGITELETGRCLEINDACLEIFGFRRDEVVGQTTLMLGIWPDPHERARFIERLKGEGAIRNFEISMRMKSGELRQFIISSNVITLGGKHCLLTIGHDITERKQAEVALRESEQRFRAIYDQTYEFIGLLKPDGTLIDANRTALAFRGLQLSDVAGKPFWETPWWDISVELQEKLREGITEAAQGKFVHIQIQHRAADGTIEDIDFSLTPITDRNGKVTEIIPEGRRITALTGGRDQLRQAHEKLERLVRERTAEYDKAIESLRESEERIQGMLDHSPSPIWLKDLQGCYLDVNQQFERTFHRTRQDIIGKTDHDIFPPEHATAYRANDLEVLKAGRSLQFEEVALHDDGPHTNIVSKFPVRRRDGMPYGVCGIATDITERKRAEQALREREALTGEFLDNSATVAWMKDAEGRYIFISPSFERRFNARLEDWWHKTDFELWPREVAEQFRENDLAVLRQNSVIEVVEEFHNPDGSRSWWLSHKFPYQDTSGKRYVGGLAVDITERKKAEEALHQNQLELRRYQTQLEELTSKLLSARDNERQRIARDLHDDFSQRLAALMLDVAALQLQPPLLPELIAKSLEPVQEQLEQLSDDIHKLAYQLYPSLVEHAGLQPAIEDHIHKVTERTGLHIVLKANDVPAAIPLEWATCLFRVLQESLQNIVKHANATEVLVKLSGSSKGIGLSVADNGMGFDVGDKSLQQKGLGLISMQERLRLLKGFLRIHSKPADGTKVCAWIPFQGSAL